MILLGAELTRATSSHGTPRLPQLNLDLDGNIFSKKKKEKNKKTKKEKQEERRKRLGNGTWLVANQKSKRKKLCTLQCCTALIFDCNAIASFIFLLVTLTRSLHTNPLQKSSVAETSTAFDKYDPSNLLTRTVMIKFFWLESPKTLIV